MTNPNGSYTLDAAGFIVPETISSFNRAAGICQATANRIVYNLDRPASTFTSIEFILPYAGTPTKFFLFKQPNKRSTDIQYKLYAVKDNAAWVNPASFDVATDAIEIAATGATVGTAGYLEFPIALTSSYFDAGLFFQSGFGSWLEGRMYMELTAGGGQSGFVGVEYM
jgi:hypothetical protein